MKRIIYFYGSLLWSFVQAFAFGCLIWTLNEYIFSNPNPKQQADIVAVVLMSLILLVCVFVDSKIRKYNEWYMLLLSLVVSPIRFIFQIITIVKFHQSGNSKDFAPRGGYYTKSFSDWAMYVLFSTISLSKSNQYKPHKSTSTYGDHHSGNYTGPTLDYEKRYKVKTRSTTSSYTPPESPSVYSDEYQSKYYRCRDCRYFTTYQKEVEGFLITSVDQGWCSRNGYETEEYEGPCFDFVKK